MFANVGSASSPQAKVIGVKCKFGAPRDLAEEFHCRGGLSSCSLKQDLEVVTSVSFVDVTRPAVEQFAEFPVIEAKFPHDFFYPFVSDDWRRRRDENGGRASAGSERTVQGTRVVVITVFLMLVQYF